MAKNPAKPGPKMRPMHWSLLAVTAIVAGAAIHVATIGSRRASPADGAPKASEVDEVLSKAGRLVETAEQLAPHQTAERRLAHETARDLMLAWVRLHLDDVRVRPRLADLYLRMDDPARAQAVAEELLAIRPGWTEATWLKGLALLAQGKPEGEPLIRQAADSNDATAPMLSRYGLDLMASQPARAEAYLGRARQAGAKDAPTLSALARVALQRGALRESEMLLLEAVRDPAAGPAAWRMLALVQKENGRLEEAAQSARRGIEAIAADRQAAAREGIDKGDFLLLMGRILVLQNRHRQAAETFDEASRYSLVEGEACFQAAQCWYHVGRYAMSLARIDAAQRFMPQDPAVARWKTQIEDAHFPRPGAASNPSPVK
jgi:tetratricopeptide (TPR) repeat protein